jgi:hypothetical protein
VKRQAEIEVQTMRHENWRYLSIKHADPLTSGIRGSRIIVLFAEHHSRSGREEQHASVRENH